MTKQTPWISFLAIVFVAGFAGAGFAATIPFTDGFETNAASQDLDGVEGASGWETTDGFGGADVTGRAIVQTSVKSAGNNGVIVTNGTLVNNFTTTGLSNVWTSVDIRPVFHEGTPTIPSNSTVGFFFFSNGNVRVFNGHTVSNLGNTSISTTSFQTVRVFSDYANQTWDLYIGDTQVANDLNFYSNLVTAYDELLLDQDEITQPAYLDEVAINENSPLTPTLTWSGDSVVTNNEGTVRVLTAILNFSAQITVTGNVAEIDGTTESGDITLASSQFTIASGSTSATVNVTITDDVEHETPYESGQVTMTSPNATVGSASNVTIVINDDADTPPNLYFTSSTGSGSESGLGTVTVQARLDGTPQEDVSVTVVVSNTTTATQGAGGDFTLNNTTLNFSSGNVAPDSELGIVVVDNSQDEPTETVVLHLPSGSGTVNSYASVATSNAFTLTITDDDVSTLPFVETFDTALTPLGDLNNQHGWSSSNTIVTAASGLSKFSSQSAYSSNNGALAHTLTDTSATNVWTTFYIQPTLGEGSASAIPSNASVAFFVNGSGLVVAYSNNTQVTLANTPIASNSCPKFTVHSDYGADTYDLYLDDSLIASSLAFYTNTAPNQYTEFIIGGDGNSSSIVDNINIAIDNPFFAITSVIEQVGNAARIFVDNASIGSQYRLLKKGQGDSGFSVLQTQTANSLPFYFDDSTLAGESQKTRQYKVVNFNAESDNTNAVTWIAQQQTRLSNRWHMVSVPGQFGDTNQNLLSANVGDELMKGLSSGPDNLNAGQCWVFTGGTWVQRWLADLGGGNSEWREVGGAAATDRINPGEGVWVKAYTVADDSGILAGQVHTSTVPISMPAGVWRLFAWPFPEAEANSVAGWGFSNGTITAGTSWDNSSRIFMEDSGNYYNLWLDQSDGLWKIQNTSTIAPVSLRPGQAYYFYNAGGGAATYVASQSN